MSFLGRRRDRVQTRSHEVCDVRKNYPESEREKFYLGERGQWRRHERVGGETGKEKKGSRSPGGVVSLLKLT